MTLTYKEFKFTLRVLNNLVKYFIWFKNTSEFYLDAKNFKPYKSSCYDFITNGYKKYDFYQQKIYIQFMKIFKILFGNRKQFNLYIELFVENKSNEKILFYLIQNSQFKIINDYSKINNYINEKYKKKFININRILNSDLNIFI